MALPNPTSAWKLAKFLLRAAEYAIPAGVAYLESAVDYNEEDAAVEWMRWVFVFDRTTPTGTSEDKGQFKIDLLNITSGAIDTSWTSGDFTTVKARADTFLTGIKTQLSPAITFTEYRAYRMAFDPSDPGPAARKGSGLSAFAETGPPVYRSTISVAGTGSGYVPYQVAATVTLRTAFPRHWGRFYIPCPQPSVITTNGRLNATAYQTFAQVTKTMVSGLADDGFLTVVPVTDLNKSAFHALLGVTEIVCDDIPDVQRKRRPKQPAIRYIAP